jgi:hypothetical protein
MNASLFKWDFSVALTIKSPNGASPLTEANSGAYPKYYAEKEISVVMPASAQTITLTVNEWSMPKTGTGCEGTDSTWNIVVVNRPTLLWPSTKEVGGCVATAVTIPLTLTGKSDWVVTYDILYTAYTSGAPQTTKLTNQSATVGSAKSLTIASTVFDTPGKYEVKITNLSDRISRKSLDVINAVVGTDIPAAADTYVVHVYPTPKTQILEHVRNF